MKRSELIKAMKKEDFYVLVRQMRNAQKKYFLTRDKGILTCSKELERRVDIALQEYFEPKLF